MTAKGRGGVSLNEGLVKGLLVVAFDGLTDL